MNAEKVSFDVHASLHRLRHYLPAQTALKDFVHHNTLHAFEHQKFHDALHTASRIFGYTTYLSLDEFRDYYQSGKIRKEVLEKTVSDYCVAQGVPAGALAASVNQWVERLLHKTYNEIVTSRLGTLRSYWKTSYNLNMDKMVHPVLFRLLSAFLDQGIAMWEFPGADKPFIDALRELERESTVSIFKSKNVKQLFLSGEETIESLLFRLTGDPALYEHYLFDQQFSHPGWSGFVSVVEKQPQALLRRREISLADLVYLELLLETDALDQKFGNIWSPLSHLVPKDSLVDIFEEVPETELKTVFRLWQEAFEWSYFNDVLVSVRHNAPSPTKPVSSFQGLFCIDDREYSFRRHVENVDPDCETFGTPGFFGVEFYFQPENSRFYTKACPAPVTPGFLIRETGRKDKHKKDYHFARPSHSLFRGWLISNTLGIGSAYKLLSTILRPSVTPSTSYSFEHMDKHAKLTIDSTGETENGLKVGFTPEEMATRVAGVLKSIGLTDNFARIVYVVGHGGSSVNNPYYAGYNCGACCGRPGSVNARVFAYMANKAEVRSLLLREGITIPYSTVFIGAMQDTTRDEIEFYDDDALDGELRVLHTRYRQTFEEALVLNARERSFRFDTMDRGKPVKKIHQDIKRRSVSLFEPRPEWNHTANALCLIGSRALYGNLYLDKRPFINSYDYRKDPEGDYLLAILNAAFPVCAGISLEYYFSRVDQQALGSGTKLPHNVVGLFAVANGIEGDLRPGLPSQMIEIHDPVRMHFIIEQKPGVVLNALKGNPGNYLMILNEWVLVSVKDPDTGNVYRFKDGAFEPYEGIESAAGIAGSEEELIPHYTESALTIINY